MKNLLVTDKLNYSELLKDFPYIVVFGRISSDNNIGAFDVSRWAPTICEENTQTVIGWLIENGVPRDRFKITRSAVAFRNQNDCDLFYLAFV